MNSVDPGKKKRAKWTQNDLSKAISDVRDGRLSVNAASKRHDVPRRTLRRYLTTKTTVKAKLGRNATLTKNQESELCSRIFRLAEVGYPLTSKTLKLNVYKYCNQNGISHRFSKGSAGRYWLKSFLERNPEVKQRKAQRLNPARAQKVNKFIVEDHFAKLQKLLVDNNLLDFPEKIFNMDEKGCRLQLHKDPQVFAKKGSKRIHIVAKEHGENVTIVACGNATGYVIPPMILFAGVRKNPAWEKGLPTGSTTKMTPKGCMNTETFVEFLRHFARFKPSGLCLLIFDGAKSHLDYSICEFAEENAILLYCLPSNTTHELQPLDKGCFRSFEIFWDQHALLYFTTHREEQDISRLNFADVFTPTWEKSMTQANMKSGFRATGIFPFNPLKLPKEAFAPSTPTELPPPETTAIQNVPSVNSQPIENDLAPEPGPSGYQTNIRRQRRRLQMSSSSDTESSEDLDSPEYSYDSDDLNTPGAQEHSSKHTSFTELLLTPKNKRKTNRVMPPAMNSRGVILAKELFVDKKCLKNTDKSRINKNRDDSNHGKRKAPSKKTSSKKTESWYCAVCCEDAVKDMRLCAMCGLYVHEECVGLTKEDTDLFICPKCVQ